MVYKNNLLILLFNILYISSFGINLISNRHIYKIRGLISLFNFKYIYYKLDKKRVITVKIDKGLYIVNYIAKKYIIKEKVF